MSPGQVLDFRLCTLIPILIPFSNVIFWDLKNYFFLFSGTDVIGKNQFLLLITSLVSEKITNRPKCVSPAMNTLPVEEFKIIIECHKNIHSSLFIVLLPALIYSMHQALSIIFHYIITQQSLYLNMYIVHIDNKIQGNTCVLKLQLFRYQPLFFSSFFIKLLQLQHIS